MEWVETIGKTLEEARDRALDQLGVDEHDAEIVIVDEPRPGLFGRVRGEARIRARVAPRVPRPKVERRSRRPRKGEAGVGEPAAELAPASGRAPRPSPKKKAAAGRRRAESSAPAGRSRRSSSSGSATSVADPASDKEARVSITAKEQAELVDEFLVGLGTAFGVTGTCEIEEVTEDLYEVRYDGEGDLGVLIGPRAVTLHAVQELAKAVVNRRVDGEREGRFRIDIGGYRAKRSHALARFTVQVAEQVLETGVSKALEPMGSADRKVVHDTVNAMAGVRTISEGQDPYRRVRIFTEGDSDFDDGAAGDLIDER